MEDYTGQDTEVVAVGDAHRSPQRSSSGSVPLGQNIFHDPSSHSFVTPQSPLQEMKGKTSDDNTRTHNIISTYFPLGSMPDETLPRRTYANVVATCSKAGDGDEERDDGTQTGVRAARKKDAKHADRMENRRDDDITYGYPAVHPSATLSTHPTNRVPYVCHPDAFKWLHMYGSANPRNGPRDYDFENDFKFESSLAKTADDKAKKHLQNLGKTIKTIARIVGILETAYVAVRGCFYGFLHALEYGTHGWQLLEGFPLVRLFFATLRQLWCYIKFVGRNGPLVGFFALICTFVGRAVIPVLRKLLPSLDGRKTKTVHALRSFKAHSLRELTVQEGEELVIEEQPGTKSNADMIMVRKVNTSAGGYPCGLVPKSVITKINENLVKP